MEKPKYKPLPASNPNERGIMALIYLAGCYTRHPIKWLPRPIATPLNIIYAWAKSRKLWAKGYYVICPMMNTALHDGAADYETFMAGCFTTIARVDKVAFLPNYIYSSGAKRELAYAISIGKPVRYFGRGTDPAWVALRDSLPDGYDFATITP